MINKSKGDIAYTIIEVSEFPTQELLNKLNKIDGIKFVRNYK